MRAPDPRIALVARNNAEWCDAVTRSRGGEGRFEAALWINPGEAPPFYPNAVTLAPMERVPTAIAAPRGDFAVKDSFALLDLTPLGFAPLFDAMWIWRAAAAPATDAAVDWRIVRDAAALAEWETAWRGEEPGLDLFRPTLLDAPDHAFIAGRVAGRIAAGCVASRSAEVIGFSNWFGPSDLLPSCLSVVAGVAANRPVVGYETADALETMKSFGFQTLGPLRVWARRAG